MRENEKLSGKKQNQRQMSLMRRQKQHDFFRYTSRGIILRKFKYPPQKSYPVDMTGLG
jgi:hypothetical protein